MTTAFFCLSLLTLAPVIEVRANIEAMGSTAAGHVLIVTTDGGWEERLSSGKVVRAGRVELGPGQRLLERAAIAPDGTKWAAVIRDTSGAASVLAFDWGTASPKQRWLRVTRNVEQVRWWGNRLVLRTDGDGVQVLGEAPTPERSFPDAYGIAVAADQLLVNDAAECWTPTKGERFVCLRQAPFRAEVRNKKRAGAVEHLVSLPLEANESALETALGADGAAFVVSTSNRRTSAIHHLVIDLASGAVDRRAEGKAPPTNFVERTYGLLTLVSSAADSPQRVWTTDGTSVSFAQLGPTRFLIGSGNRLSRLDTTTWKLEPLAAAPEGGTIIDLAVSGNQVLVTFANGVSTLTGNALSALRPFEEPWAFVHVTQDRRLVLAWQTSGTHYAVIETGLRPNGAPRADQTAR